MKLGAVHGEHGGDPAAHEAEFRHHASPHGADGEEMFGQGYTDGLIAGTDRAEKRQAENARKLADLEYGQASTEASRLSNAALRANTPDAHKAAVHGHVAAGRAALAAGRRDAGEHHVKMATTHKAAADRAAARATRLEGSQAVTITGPNAGKVTEGKSTATAGSVTEKPAASIRVEHTGDGTLVHGTERGDTETNDALKAQGFKWSRNLNAWYLPRTWNESTRDTRVPGPRGPPRRQDHRAARRPREVDLRCGGACAAHRP
jgi:hypothetical protein